MISLIILISWGLPKKIEKHDLIEFRRIAAYLYKNNKRYELSIALSKEDKMYKDAIDTAAASGDEKLAESLLDFFVNIGNKPCFTATLYTCSSLVRPEVALELAWKNGLMDFAMPFMIQFVANASAKLKEIDERTKPKEDEEAAAGPGGMDGQNMMMNPGMLALPDQGMGMMPNMGGMPGQQMMGVQQMGQMPQMPANKWVKCHKCRANKWAKCLKCLASKWECKWVTWAP